MKIRTDRDILRFLGIGLGMILFGIVMCLFLHPHAVGFGFILGGLIILVAGFYTATKPKIDIMMDERYTRINEKAGYAAFWIVLLTVTILFWTDRVGSLGVELEDMYYAVLFVGIISWFILRWYYNKRSMI